VPQGLALFRTKLSDADSLTADPSCCLGRGCSGGALFAVV